MADDEIDLLIDGKKVEPIEDSEIFGIGVCPAGGKHMPGSVNYNIYDRAVEQHHGFAVCTKCCGVILTNMIYSRPNP